MFSFTVINQRRPCRSITWFTASFPKISYMRKEHDSTSMNIHQHVLFEHNTSLCYKGWSKNILTLVVWRWVSAIFHASFSIFRRPDPDQTSMTFLFITCHTRVKCFELLNIFTTIEKIPILSDIRTIGPQAHAIKSFCTSPFICNLFRLNITVDTCKLWRTYF